MNYTYQKFAIRNIDGETIRYDLKYKSLKVQNQVQSNLNKIVEQILENMDFRNPWHKLTTKISMGYQKQIESEIIFEVEEKQEKQRKQELETQRKAREYFVD